MKKIIFTQKKLYKAILPLILIALLTPTLPALNTAPSGKPTQLSQDSWPLFRYDRQNTGSSPSTAPNTPTMLWTTYINETFEATAPTIANGKLYIGSFSYSRKNAQPLITKLRNHDPATFQDSWGHLYCFNTTDGTQLWSFLTDAIESAPAIQDDKVYFASIDMDTSDLNSTVYCLDANTGSVNWETNVTGPAFLLSPMLTETNIYFTDLFGGRLFCFDIQTGTLEWTYSCGGTYFECSLIPTIANDKIYVNCYDFYNNTGYLFCFNAETGTLLWQSFIGQCEYGSPVVANGKVVVNTQNTTTYAGEFICFNSTTGTQIWKHTLIPYKYSRFFCSPAVNDNYVYFAAQNTMTYNSTLYCFNLNTGTVIWTAPLDNIVSASPSIADNKIYVIDEDGILNCFDTNTGTPLWQDTLIYGAFACPTIAEERLYIADFEGNLYAYEDPLKITTIKGGLLSATVEITNTGTTTLSNLNYTLEATGGILGFINLTDTGSIATMTAGETIALTLKPLIGLGPITITATIDVNQQYTVTKTADGLILLIFIMM